MERLKRRTDFRAAGTGVRVPGRAFVLQVRRRDAAGPARVGFTVSRQVGNAVERNRVRRRLREVVRLAPEEALRGGHDYVLIARRAALAAPFDAIAQEFAAGLRRAHHTPARSDGAAATGAGDRSPLHETGSPAKRPQATSTPSGRTLRPRTPSRRTQKSRPRHDA